MKVRFGWSVDGTSRSLDSFRDDLSYSLPLLVGFDLVEVDHGGRLSAMGGVGPLVVVEGDPPANPGLRLRAGLPGVRIDASYFRDLLLYDGTYFLQTIEGPHGEIGDVFTRIAGDKRHTDVVPFGIAEIAERVFPDWRMKLIGPRATARIVPDMEEFDFSDRRLSEVHLAAKLIANRGPRPCNLMH